MTDQTVAAAHGTDRTAGTGPLPRSTPAEQGVDPAAVLALLDAVQAAGIELHSLMVVRSGQVVAEGWWSPYEPAELHLLYSLSKSFTSTAIGLAVHEGLLTVDDRLTSFFPEAVPSGISPYAAELRVSHLLSMATGHREDTLDRLDHHDPVRSFLALAPEEPPGTWFTYHNSATLMLSLILTRLTGQRLLDYLRPRLLEPLGIVEANWQGLGEFDLSSELGRVDLGFSGLHLATEAIAKLGQLYLQGGRWHGRQLVPGDWVTAATRVQVENPREPNPDWRRGYGYQFWMGREGYRGDGAFGQFCLVLPDHDAVVAITAATEDMQGLLDCVWSELLPGLGGPASRHDQSGAAQELGRRLSALGLPPVSGDRRVPALDLPWSAPAEAGPPAGAGVRLLEIVDIGSAWRLSVAEGDTRYAFDCGHGEWLDDELEVRPGFRLRVAASGAWTAATTFTVAVALVQTPHRLILTCDCATGRTVASWNVTPLGPVSAVRLALEQARG